jgi:hypothetical protein
MLVDSLGLVLGKVVVPTNTNGRDGPTGLLEPSVGTFKRLRNFWVDGAFSGKTFADWVTHRRPALKVKVVCDPSIFDHNGTSIAQLSSTGL